MFDRSRPVLVGLLFCTLILRIASAQGAHKPKAPGTAKPACVEGCGPGPQPHVSIVSNTFTPSTRDAQSGPYTYTITVKNIGWASGTFIATCTSLGQLPCVEPNPEAFTLGVGQTRVVTVGYNTRGIGNFSQTHTFSVGDEDKSVTVGLINVTGAPIGSITTPVYGGYTSTADTIKVAFASPSGVNSSTFRLLIDGKDSTPHATTTPNSIYAVGLHLDVGAHKVTAYGCESSGGRCDSIPAVPFTAVGPPTQFSVDDSLPTPGPGGGGGFPGAIPLPPVNYRGCPVAAGDPEIRLASPSSYIGQPPGVGIPGGIIFLPIANWDTSLAIVSVYYDRMPTDTTTCAKYTYLSDTQYDWNFWIMERTPQTDSLWAVYPYGDLGQGGGGGGGGAPQSFGPIGGVAGVLGLVSEGSAAKGPVARKVPIARPNLAGDPGAINPNTYNVLLNGVQIIQNNVPIGTFVRYVSSNLGGATFNISASHPNMHRYDPLHPTSDNGGWNEMLASIADSTGHTSYVRTRFVQLPPRTIQDLQLTALEDFGHLDQSECAAFGVFQCGGVTLTHTIPGFTTRDKDRSLHLVYRSNSQRAPTAVPYQLTVSIFQTLPDSLEVTPLEGAASVGGTVRYFGAISPGPATPLEPVLTKYGTELRVLGVEVPPPGSGDAAIRSIQTKIKAYYGSNTRENATPAQDVVQLYLSDTTSTRFGQGWSLAEQSRLILGQQAQGQNAAIWLYGDGSYTIFRSPTPNQWTVPPGESAKLLDSLSTPGLTARYVITLPNGATIGYDATGWQRYTADLVGNRTTFAYAGSRLVSITDPSGLWYEFLYNAGGAPGQVSDVVVHGTGGATTTAATFAYDATGRRLTKVKIWRSPTQGDSTRFGYLSSATAGAYLDTIVDPRSTGAAPIITTYLYDTLSTYTPVLEARLPGFYDGSVANFRDAWRRAVPRTGRGRAGPGTQAAERLIYLSQLRGTLVDHLNQPTDFMVDKFNGTSWVRRISPQPIMTPDFLVITFGGDDVRRITRDSLGRVVKIVHAPDSAGIADSVMYRYTPSNVMDRLIRSTLQYPTTPTITLDTIAFTYDSVTTGLPVPGARCIRLTQMVDAMGGTDRVTYGVGGAASCLPATTIGLAQETTVFSYGPLTAGDPAGVRPISVRDPNGLVMSMQYAATNWNSNVSTREGNGATERQFYDAFGRPDSLVDAVGIRSFYRHDLAGRVYRTKTGTGTNTPVTWTFFNPGGLPDSVRVYGSNDDLEAGQDGVPVTAVQTTKYYYNRRGHADSIVTAPVGAAGRRNQSFRRDRAGRPIWEFPGNGSYITRLYDWQGRLASEYQSAVHPTYTYGGSSFADATTTSIYTGAVLGTPVGINLNHGNFHTHTYDNKNREVVGDDSIVVHRRGYSRTGALIADTAQFAAGPVVARSFKYNRRGQRVWAGTAVSGVTVAEPADSTTYVYNATTARLDSMAEWVGGASLGRARWTFDVGGRETGRFVRVDSLGASSELAVRMEYDAAGRLSLLQDSSATGIWYQFHNPTYTLMDELTLFSGVEPWKLGGPPSASQVTYWFTYATDGTRRLLHSDRSASTSSPKSYDWTYDVFGNRVREQRAGAAPCAGVPDTSIYGGANVLLKTVAAQCSRFSRYWTDNAGNRLGQTDSTYPGSGYLGAQQRMAYTARNQLYFSWTHAAWQNMNDYNWHWYDGSGMRTATAVTSGSSFDQSMSYTAPAVQWNLYVYDGSDVALTLVRTGVTWRVQSRYMVGGVDQTLAGRFTAPGTGQAKNLTLIADRQGTTLAAMRTNGAQEDQAWWFSRNPFGSADDFTASGSGINTETGFAGASTPNSGGFVYLRNRWYDPSTGRFLTQDPIGLAGGVNLYSYAGSNPVAFADPFGLICPDACVIEGGATLAAGVVFVGVAAGALIAGAPFRDAVGDAAQAGADVIQGAIGAITTALATSQTHNIERTQGQIQQAITHLGGVANMGPNDQDPRKRGDWLKDAQKAINNARKYAEKIKGKTGEGIRDTIRKIQDLHDHLANP